MAAKVFDGIPLSDLDRLRLGGARVQEVIDFLVEAHGARPILAAVEKHRKKPKVFWAQYAAQIGTVELVKSALGLKSDIAACEKIARVLGTSSASALRQKLVRARAALRGTRHGEPENRQQLLQEEMSYWKRSGWTLDAWIMRTRRQWLTQGKTPSQS